MLLEMADTDSGYLFLLDEDGSLAIKAGRPDATPPATLTSQLTDYVQAELDQASDITATWLDPDTGSQAAPELSGFHAVLLSDVVDGEHRVVGIAALALTEGALDAELYSVMSALSRALVEPRVPSVVSVFS